MKKIFSSKKNTKGYINKYRIFFLSLFIALFAFALIYRLFTLQILEHESYIALASGQYEIFKKLFPERGKIYIRDDEMISFETEEDYLFPLATNQTVYEIYAQPKYIKDPIKVHEQLIKILNITEDEEKELLLAKLSKEDDPYEPVKRKVETEVMEEVKKLELEGIGFKPFEFRYYPEKNLASNILGFVREEDNKSTGQYGIEGFFNDELNGEQGYLKSERDAFGRWIAVSDRKFKEAVNGADIVLTINKSIQYVACEELTKAVELYEAESGSLIIMDPNTGSIISMCNAPDFDPNIYFEVEDINVFTNRSIYSAYEPGSIFKPVTMAGALDSEVVTQNTTYEDTGFVPYNDAGEVDYANSKYQLRNYDRQAHGIKNMTEILEESLNTGTIFLMQKMGEKVFKQYVKDFGFGQLNGIELDTESPGNISSLNKKGELFSATASFGQGITATPLQMVSAYAAFANGGKLMRPYIVDEIRNADGTIKKTEPQVISQPINMRTSAILTGMLISVIDNGHAKKAGVEGYYLAGKTGTAQVASQGVYGAKTIHSFVGYGPYENEKFVMLVRLDGPKAADTSSETAAPVFGNIARFILDYYKVPPQR